VNDAPIIAWHRARMFQDMGELSAFIFDDFPAKGRWLSERMGFAATNEMRYNGTFDKL
jgi:hypothetical protein